jgi:hypothetical protein
MTLTIYAIGVPSPAGRIPESTITVLAAGAVPVCPATIVE